MRLSSGLFRGVTLLLLWPFGVRLQATLDDAIHLSSDDGQDPEVGTWCSRPGRARVLLGLVIGKPLIPDVYYPKCGCVQGLSTGRERPHRITRPSLVFLRMSWKTTTVRGACQDTLKVGNTFLLSL